MEELNILLSDFNPIIISFLTGNFP